ncbi:MAG: hypothetical protein DRJ40_02940 [Thermoprotei archaeon]|nr:MAG: hypothetical protein DRJ40_02940 [Thermoprotei archaeon]
MIDQSTNFKIYIEGIGKWISFVDRERELKQLINLATRGNPFPIAIYGPEGCGKTTLLKYLTKQLKQHENYIAIYIDALEQQDLAKAIACTHHELWEVVTSLVAITPVGENLAKSITTILRKLHEKISLKGKKVVVVVDDVYKAIGLNNVARYTKMLYEWVNYLHTNFNVSTVLFILTTSEGESKRELYRHTYVHVYMMWNLPKKGLEELAKQLEAPIDIEALWKLTGGNPRAVIDLAIHNWDVDNWTKYIERKVTSTIRDIDPRELKTLVEDPDSNWRIATKLEERGLMMELNRALVIGEEPNPNPELGIGREWAWQLPIYRQVIEKIVSSK